MANIEDVEMVDPEQDTRVKTHIIPINVQAKHNTFDIFLSQPINVLSNAITFVDLNLKGTPVIPVFNTINTPQIFKYQQSNGGAITTVNIQPGYYTVDELFKLCNFTFAKDIQVIEVKEDPSIDPSVSYTKKEELYRPTFEVSAALGNNIYSYRMNDQFYRAIIPDGTYDDLSYFWTGFKLVNYAFTKQSNHIYHYIEYDEATDSIKMAYKDTGTCTFLGETCTVDYSLANTWYWSSGVGLEKLKAYINWKQDWKLHDSYTFKRVVNLDQYIEVVVREGFNTFTIVVESLDVPEDKLKFTFNVPGGIYRESTFYALLAQQFNDAHQAAGTDLYFALSASNDRYGHAPRINHNYCKWYFTADNLDQSLFVYRGVLHNIQPNRWYKNGDNELLCVYNYGKDTMTYTELIEVPSANNFNSQSDAYMLDFSSAKELQEIFGFANSLYIGSDRKYSARAVDITRNHGMLICDTNLTDNSSNSLYAFNIENPIGNNQFHDRTSVIVNSGLEEIQHITFRFKDLGGNMVYLNDGAMLSGFLELSDIVDRNPASDTIKKLCLNFQTYDDHFQTVLPNMSIEDKIIKDVTIQCDTDEIDNRYKEVRDLCTCTINNNYYPSFVFPLNEKLLYYGDINAPIDIDQQIDVRFNYPFRGNVVCNICEPSPPERRFQAYDEVYCDFTKSNNFVFSLDKATKYNYQYVTNIQVMSDCGISDQSDLVNNNPNCITGRHTPLPGFTIENGMKFYYTINTNNGERLQTATVPKGVYPTFKSLLYAIFDAMNHSEPFYTTAPKYRWVFTLDEDGYTFTTYVSKCNNIPDSIKDTFYNEWSLTNWPCNGYDIQHQFKFGNANGILSDNDSFNELYRYVFRRVDTYQDSNLYGYVEESFSSKVYPVTLASYVSPYENIIHIIDSSNLPYYYTYGCKYDSIKSKLADNIYYCNRQILKLLPNDIEFHVTCYYPCTVIITVSYL